jgi:hypothetical protein
MTLSHKGRYWQVSGLEKQVGLRAIIYIRAPAGECSKGRFRALFGGARRSETRTPVSDAPSPPVPFFLTPPEGAGGIPSYRRWPTARLGARRSLVEIGLRVRATVQGRHARCNAELRCRTSRTNCCMARAPNDDDPSADRTALWKCDDHRREGRRRRNKSGL